MRASNRFGVSLLLAIACCWAPDSQADEVQDKSNATEYVTWQLPVAISSNAAQTSVDLAKTLNRSLRLHIGLLQPESNPICCLWIEVGDAGRMWPYPEGYLILLGRGGGQLLASSDDELKKAIKHLESLAQSEANGAVRLPLGLVTNIPANQSIHSRDATTK